MFTDVMCKKQGSRSLYSQNNAFVIAVGIQFLVCIALSLHTGTWFVLSFLERGEKGVLGREIVIVNFTGKGTWFVLSFLEREVKGVWGRDSMCYFTGKKEFEFQ